jgi:hypothetical protein
VKPRQTRLLLVVVMALSGPAMFGLDLIARHFVLSAQPADLQDFLADSVTRVAWFLVPGPVLAGVAGFFLYRALYRRALARPPLDVAPAEAADRADLTSLLFSASLPQLAGLCGDLSVILGARLWPAICMCSLTLCSVLLIAAFARPAGVAPAVVP